MGYIAVGVGKTEFDGRRSTRSSASTRLQKEQPPFVLAGNVMGVVDGQAQFRSRSASRRPGRSGR